MSPVVSIVLPAFNAASCISRAIASVRAQTLRDWELVVVDDGSTDDTSGAAREAVGGDGRIRIVRVKHAGIVGALETGIAAARAQLIARLDADDEMMPDRLEAQVKFLGAHPEIGVASSLVGFGGDAAAARGYALHVEWINSLLTPEAIALGRFIESPIAHPSVMFRRELIDRHGGYRESDWPEDYELWLRWMDAGVRFGKVGRVLTSWNDPPDRLSHVHPRYSEDAFYACKCHWLARWLKSSVGDARPVFLWGAGRITRKRFAGLAEHGVRLGGFIDVDRKKTGRTVGGLPVIAPDELPVPGRMFVIGGVGARGARELIRAALISRDYGEGRDFIMAA